MRLLERVSFRAALAIECHDGVSGRPVSVGLSAQVWLREDPARRFTARRSPTSGVLGVAVLPGLALTRVGEPGVDMVWTPDTPVGVCALVSDTQGRYLPVSIAVDAPVKAEVTLSSQPACLAPSGCATVRGQVRDTNGSPLPWSMVDVDGRTTVADGRGVFVLYPPWPDALPPLGGPAAGLSDLTWDVEVRVRSEPSALRTLAGLGPADPPELASIEGQAAAALRDGGADHALLTETLHFGQPLDLTLTAVPS